MLPIHVLAALGLASSAAADYYIDNANNTVSYAASTTNWRTFSFATQNLTLALSNGNVPVDSSKCYDQNYALAACTVQDNCRITFPFTGSGISLFVMHAGFQGISASLTIDGSQTVTATLPAPGPPSYQTPNVSLFDLQSLPSADHTATIDLLDWENGTTSLYFDYALINESFVELPASPSTFPLSSTSSLSATRLLVTNSALNSTTATLQSSTTHPASASSTITSAFVGSTLTPRATSAVSNTGHSVNVGAVVGGTCGGLAVLISVITAIIFLKKCKSQQAKLEESQRPDPFTIIPALACDQIVPSPVHPQTAQKAQLRLASRNAMVYQSRRVSDGDLSDFHILSTAGSAGRHPGVVARPSPVDPFPHDDFVIDCGREHRSLPDFRGSSNFRGSSVRNITPTPTGTIGSASSPPGYQTVDLRHSDASHSPL